MVDTISSWVRKEPLTKLSFVFEEFQKDLFEKIRVSKDRFIAVMPTHSWHIVISSHFRKRPQRSPSEGILGSDCEGYV